MATSVGDDLDGREVVHVGVRPARDLTGALALDLPRDTPAAAALGLHTYSSAVLTLAIRVARRLGSDEVIDVLADVMVTRGIPDHVRSDNGPEFIALRLRQWLADVGAQTLYIEPGSPWENGYCESFNSKLRDEFLNGEIFYSLKEAQILTERWRVHYNTVRPHSSLGYRPPAPMAYRLAMPPPSESRSVPSAVM